MMRRSSQFLAPQIPRLAGIDPDEADVDAALTRCSQILDQESGGVRLYHTTLPGTWRWFVR